MNAMLLDLKELACTRTVKQCFLLVRQCAKQVPSSKYVDAEEPAGSFK
jgi:hypothetical protein